MRMALAALVLSVLLGGCFINCSKTDEPRCQKESLYISVSTSEGKEMPGAEIYLDGQFIGNPLQGKIEAKLKRGEHVIRVMAAGYKPYEKTISIIDLGEKNFQMLNVLLEKQ